MKDYKKQFEELVLLTIQENASDLHITAGRHPTIRVSGGLIPLIKIDILTPEDSQGLIFAMLDEKSKKELVEKKELDFSYSFGDKARFRVNAYVEKGQYAAALRLIPSKISSFKELLLPEILADFAKKEQGFFLVVGPIGHGKSTTLAAMVDHINHTKAEHILTIEDPVEYLFAPDKSIISQREVRSDTADFGTALRSMFREDINVAMIGEMRDMETIGAAVTAAETGHMVLSSLHTNNASQTIDRIIDTFPAVQQNQIRVQLANALVGIFSQRLIPRVSGGRVPAYELLISTPAVRNLIRENRTHELEIVIETGFELGMVSLNRSLSDLVRQGEITVEDAVAYSLNPKGLEGML